MPRQLPGAMSSYWHATIDRDPLPADELPPAANVVVVGGGVLGACTALWLARAGAAPLLIERAGPAAGASGHNGGLLVSGTAESYPNAIARLGCAQARAVYGASLTGYSLMRGLIADEAIACDLRPVGNISLALNEAGLEQIRQAVALARADGFPADLLDREAAQKFFGTPLSADVVGGMLNPVAAALHSARLVHGLLAAARRRGARLCWNSELRSVRQDGTGLKLETAQGTVRAGAVVLALNAWSGDLLPALAGLITPVRGQALSTTPTLPLLRGGFGANHSATGEYGQQAIDGSIVFGGCRAVAPGRDVRVRTTGGSPEVQAALDDGLARLFPTLAGLPVTHRWSGTMGFTADYTPLADAVPGMAGAWFAGGFSGHGMPFAALFGRLLAEAARSGVLPDALHPFRLARPTLTATPK